MPSKNDPVAITSFSDHDFGDEDRSHTARSIEERIEIDRYISLKRWFHFDSTNVSLNGIK